MKVYESYEHANIELLTEVLEELKIISEKLDSQSHKEVVVNMNGCQWDKVSGNLAEQILKNIEVLRRD